VTDAPDPLIGRRRSDLGVRIGLELPERARFCLDDPGHADPDPEPSRQDYPRLTL